MSSNCDNICAAKKARIISYINGDSLIRMFIGREEKPEEIFSSIYINIGMTGYTKLFDRCKRELFFDTQGLLKIMARFDINSDFTTLSIISQKTVYGMYVECRLSLLFFDGSWCLCWKVDSTSPSVSSLCADVERAQKRFDHLVASGEGPMGMLSMFPIAETAIAQRR